MSLIGQPSTVLKPRNIKALEQNEVVQYSNKEIEELCKVLNQPGAPGMNYKAGRTKHNIPSFKIFAQNAPDFCNSHGVLYAYSSEFSYM